MLDLVKTYGMACKCKDKILTIDTPCHESDISFKKAYLALNKKYIELCAKQQEEAKIMFSYTKKALDFMDKDQRHRFIEINGRIIGNRSYES